MITAKELIEILEVGKRTRVVRGGKVKWKKQCPAGFKAVGNKCVKMTSKEKLTRKKSAKIGARKRKSKSKGAANLKRKKSLRMRKSRKL